MRNLIIILGMLVIGILCMSRLVYLVQEQIQSSCEARGGYDDVNEHAINFWCITTDQIKNRDPEGYAVLVTLDLDSEEGRDAITAWSRPIREAIFEERYGFAYLGNAARN